MGAVPPEDILFYEVQKCHLMQNLVLEYLKQLATQNSTMECGGCNHLEGIDCYALKCMKITLFCKN